MIDVRWSPANKKRAEALVGAYPDRRSAVMPLLYLAALEYGHVTAEAQRDVAGITGLTGAQVQAVASFYTMYKREPVGAYLISVCTSISCFLLGADAVLAAVSDETSTPDGETSEDALFSIEHVECIGACGGAPALQVNYELVEGVEPRKGRELCRWLRDARPRAVLGDEMQQLFGGRRSFDWGPAEDVGAIAPVPGLDALGSIAGGAGT
jgi:NADH-quinone oxidoreductase subunit E